MKNPESISAFLDWCYNEAGIYLGAFDDMLDEAKKGKHSTFSAAVIKWYRENLGNDDEL